MKHKSSIELIVLKDFVELLVGIINRKITREEPAEEDLFPRHFCCKFLEIALKNVKNEEATHLDTDLNVENTYDKTQVVAKPVQKPSTGSGARKVRPKAVVHDSTLTNKFTAKDIHNAMGPWSGGFQAKK